MRTATEIGRVVEVLMDANRAGMEASLAVAGGLMSPSAHLLDEQRHQPYLGYVSCRPFYRGEDVMRAFGGLGWAAALTGVSRLVVMWEHQDLCVALQQPRAVEAPSAQVAVDAHRGGGHVLRWYPYQLRTGPDHRDDWPSVVPVWGEAAWHRDVTLPTPVAELLRVWREAPDVGPAREVELAELEQGGYRMRWTVQPDDTPHDPRR